MSSSLSFVWAGAASGEFFQASGNVRTIRFKKLLQLLAQPGCVFFGQWLCFTTPTNAGLLQPISAAATA